MAELGEEIPWVKITAQNRVRWRALVEELIVPLRNKEY